MDLAPLWAFLLCLEELPVLLLGMEESVSMYVIIHERRGGERRLALVCRGRNRSLMQFLLKTKIPRVHPFFPAFAHQVSSCSCSAFHLAIVARATESAKDSLSSVNEERPDFLWMDGDGGPGAVKDGWAA